MKNFILILSIAALSSSATAFMPSISSEEVYLCDSKGGKKYHFKKDCRGLSACKAPIKKLSLADAKKMGKEICGWEN